MVGASQQSIRNGRDTLFWTSKWIDSEVVLADHATVSLSDVEKERTVAEATSLDGGWDWAFLKDHLPEDIIRLVAGMEPPMTEDREDELIWGPGPKGKFSIKSAYEILDCISNESADNIWKTIWKWEGPNRVKHFIWLAAHERILTNSERCRRHIAQDSTCYRCPNICEDLLHVCRDCNLAKEVWMSLFPHRASGDFFALNFQDWLRFGIQDKELCLPFGITIWMLWKSRNEAIFEQKPVTSDQLRLRVLHWIAGVRETMKADSQVSFGGAQQREEVLIQWKPAPEEFTNLGSCSIMRAELRAAEFGLQLAWKLGFRKIHLQMDSKSAITSIQGKNEEDSRHWQTIRSIHNWLAKEWEVRVSHVFREANRVADLLAHHGHNLDFGISVDCAYPSVIDREIWNDFIGASSPRVILFND
ncbi:Putative ribonuclease H protein At1g65750 [Linum perenne]